MVLPLLPLVLIGGTAASLAIQGASSFEQKRPEIIISNNKNTVNSVSNNSGISIIMIAVIALILLVVLK